MQNALFPELYRVEHAVGDGFCVGGFREEIDAHSDAAAFEDDIYPGNVFVFPFVFEIPDGSRVILKSRFRL